MVKGENCCGELNMKRGRVRLGQKRTRRLRDHDGAAGPALGAAEDRKTVLSDLLRAAGDGIAFNTHFGGDGATIFQHAWALGCEGIVPKRLGSHYRSGRVDHWLQKIKNPAAPASERQAEEVRGKALGARPAHLMTGSPRRFPQYYGECSWPMAVTRNRGS